LHWLRQVRKVEWNRRACTGGDRRGKLNGTGELAFVKTRILL